MEILYITQVLFYLTFSFAIIFVTVMAAMVFYRIIKTVKKAQDIFINIESASNNVISRVNAIIDTFSLPAIVSFFKTKVQNKKKSKKVDDKKKENKEE